MDTSSHPPVARRLGTYIDCPPDAIETALGNHDSGAPGDGRLGDVLVAAELISRDDLLKSIRAQRVDRLRDCKLFANLDASLLEVLAEGFEEITVDIGQQFIHQDTPESYLYVLASGLVEVYRNDSADEETHIATIESGEPIGEMGYFAGGTRSASARALETSELLRTTYDRLTECFEHTPALALAFMDIVSERLRRSNKLYQENQYRLRTAERSLKHLNDFLDLSEAAELGAGIEGLIDRLVHTASSITDADRATLFLIDPANGDLWSKVAEGAEVKEIRVPPGAGIVGWVASNRKILNIPEAYDDDRFNSEVDRKTGYRTRTILCAPMWSLKNDILGVVQVINKRVGVFNEDDEALLRAFAHQAAVAVENFNLYRRMMVNHKKMAIMLDIAGSIGETLDLGTLISQIVNKTAEALHCDRGSFFVVDHDAGELWSMEARGVEMKEIRLPMTAGLAGSVASTGDIVNIADAYKDARFNPEFDHKTGYRTRSVLCVPVHDRDGRVIGVTQAINKLNGVFDDEDIDLLRAISSQIGIALENAKLHASTLSMKNYLESVQESISNSILTLDADYHVVTANRSALQLFPEADPEQARPDIRDVLGAPNAELVKLLERVYQTRSDVAEYDIELVNHRGGATVNVSVVPLTDAESNFQGLVLVLEDITNEKRVKSAFSHYLAPAVIDQLLDDPNRLTLGGEKRDLTFLFTDIAGFTTLTERTEPAVIMELLNDYFDRLCDIVLEHGGTIDKIVGDALHVMFNAPTDQPDHPQRAVACAMALWSDSEDFRRLQSSRGIDLGRTRIGLNTGSAVVGNFGGKERFDYTAYGDSINTAARLEGVNRYFGTRICVSGSTKQRCASVVFRPVGHLVLKGKVEPIDVFEPLLPEEPGSERINQYLACYGLLERKDPAATEAFAELRQRFPDDRLIEYHAERLAGGETGTTIVMTGK